MLLNKMEKKTYEVGNKIKSCTWEKQNSREIFKEAFYFKDLVGEKMSSQHDLICWNAR